MKKFLWLLVFTSFLFSQNIELKLFSKLFTDLFNKKIVYIYTENSKFKNFHSIFLKKVNSCKDADIVLGLSKKCTGKPVFLLDYYDYINNKNALGAFYWRKGRPQLRLRKKVILKYHLHIAPEFKEFLE
ncbi:hypothetical protein [Nautilia sp.]